MTHNPPRNSNLSIGGCLAALGLISAVLVAQWSMAAAGVLLTLSTTFLSRYLTSSRLLPAAGLSVCLVTLVVSIQAVDTDMLALIWASMLPALMLSRTNSDLCCRRDFSERRAFLHDVRTPLNGMTGIMEIIGLRARDPEIDRLVETAKGAGDRLTAILDRECERETQRKENAERSPFSFLTGLIPSGSNSSKT